MSTVVFLSQLNKRSGKRFEAEALRCGKFFYPFKSQDHNDPANYFEITPTILTEMKANYDSGAKGFEQLVNVGHDDNAAAGWTADLELGECSLGVSFDVLDDAVAEKVDRGLLRYLSSEIDLAWTDPETGKTMPVFEGLALTNKPYVKRMRPVQRVVDLSEPMAKACDCGCKNDLSLSDKETKPQGDHMSDSNATQLAERNKELEAKVAQLSEDKVKLEQTVSSQGAEISEVKRSSELSVYEAKLKEFAKDGRITPPIYARALSLGNVLAMTGNGTIKLSAPQKVTRVHLSEGKEESKQETIDHIDVLGEVIGMLQTLPDDLANDKAANAVLEEIGKGGKSVNLAELTDELRKRDPKLGYEEAARLAEKQLQGAKS